MIMERAGCLDRWHRDVGVARETLRVLRKFGATPTEIFAYVKGWPMSVRALCGMSAALDIDDPEVREAHLLDGAKRMRVLWPHLCEQRGAQCFKGLDIWEN